MTIDEKVTYWLDIADKDLVVAQDLMKMKHWLYVAFMCQQTIEKTIKAYHTKHQPDNPPFIHNLTRLAEKSGMYEAMTDEQKMFLDVMTPMNIEARYREYKNRLAAMLNEQNTLHVLEQTKQMQQWILQKLSLVMKQ